MKYGGESNKASKKKLANNSAVLVRLCIIF